MSKYKTEWHVRNYVKQELHFYEKNKKLLEESKNLDTHTKLLISSRLADIETALSRLSEEERSVADLIFNKRYSQAKAELEGVGYKTYYHIMNKTIYYVAQELNLI